jgi:hypothetical protein
MDYGLLIPLNGFTLGIIENCGVVELRYAAPNLPSGRRVGDEGDSYHNLATPKLL